MKIVILADLHIGCRQASDVMMRHQSKFFDFMFDYLQKHKIKNIIQLGDIWDSRKNANFKVIDFAYKTIFDRLEKQKINFYGLVGNHDIFYKEVMDITSSGLLLTQYKHVKIFDKPTTLSFGDTKWDLIPWICNQNYQQCVDYINDSNSDYCCGHFEINGYKIMYNTTFEGGFSKEVFSKYKKVFSGHFHSRGEIGNIVYVGTPYQLTWHDAFTDNGFIVFDTESKDFQYVENPYRSHYYIKYDDSKINPLSVDIDSLDLSDAFIKLVVENKNNVLVFNQIFNELQQKHAFDIKIIDQQLLDIENSQVDTSKCDIKDTLTLITQYVDNIEFDDPKIKDGVMNVIVSLYKESLNREDVDVN